MRCKAGQMAVVIKARNTANIGKFVTVETYIGMVETNSTFEYRDQLCRAHDITDHYWWVSSSSGFVTVIGETSRTYVPDSWLMPIEPPEEPKQTAQNKELEIHQ